MESPTEPSQTSEAPEMPEIRTHRNLDPRWSGRPVHLEPGRATVELATTSAMVADAHGLVHGGFVFCLADHAAMLAVNEPTVVLARADCKFLAPVTAGEELEARAELVDPGRDKGRPDRPARPRVEVRVVVRGGSAMQEGDREVFVGSFGCAVPARHVLDGAGRSTPTPTPTAGAAEGER